MIPAWSVQLLRDREREIRTAAEGRRRATARPEVAARTLEVVAVAASAEPCGEPCLDAPLARAG